MKLLPDKLASTAGNLGQRLHGWWYGDPSDSDLLDETVEEGLDTAPVEASSQRKSYAVIDEGEPIDPFEIIQGVWGPGYNYPGGAEFVTNLVKPFGFNPAMNVLDLTAGLCGPARTIVQAFNIYVIGMERSRETAQRGRDILSRDGLSRRVPISEFDPEDITLKPGIYDGIYAQHLISSVQDKNRLLREIRRGLKDNAHFTFTEFVLMNDEIQEASIEDWLSAEPYRPIPWTSQKYIDFLNGLGFNVHIAENQTNGFVSDTNAAWKAYMSSVDLTAISQRRAKAIAAEANISTQRTRLMTAGTLGAFRFYAIAR